MIENPPKLYAFWKYGITYDANGGYWSGGIGEKKLETIKDGKYPNIKNPSKDGYTFVGWYDAREGGNKIELRNSDYLVAQDNKTLYAHWVDIKFGVEVSTITNTGWTQSVREITGSLSGYTVTYHIVEKTGGIPILKEQYASSQTSTKATDKKDLTTYYVWATAKKGDVTIRSENFIEVYTGHEHKGKSSICGDCYTISQPCPKNGNKLTVYAPGGWSSSTYKSRYCCLCGDTISEIGGYATYAKPTYTFECPNCEVSVSHTNSKYVGYICSNCVDKYLKGGESALSGDTTIFENIKDIDEMKHEAKGTDAGADQRIVHIDIYGLGCRAKDYPEGVPSKSTIYPFQ